VRSGHKVGKSSQVYLGRVIDKERGIFKSRERGLFTYDPESVKPREIYTEVLSKETECSLESCNMR